MPIRPGTQIVLLETPPPISVPTDTTVWFVAGTADRGPAAPVRITSMSQFERVFGTRQTYSLLYDALDVYFREGGGSAYVSRVLGATASKGTKTLLDGASAISLTITARDSGSFSTGIFVGVVAGSAAGTFQLVVTDGTNILEQSGDLLTQSDAVGWATNSDYIRATIGASLLNPAVVAPAALSAGNDQRATITDTEWNAALNLFGTDLGPGQVSMPGRTSDTAHTQLLAHASSHNRSAVLDLPDNRTPATLKTSATNARQGAAPDERYGAAFAPWIVTPGILRGTSRTVPPSAVVAGIIARNEAGYGADSPSAGVRGVSRTAVGLSQDPYTDVERDDLNTSSVNIILTRFGVVTVYGWRSLVNPTSDPDWIDFGNSRLRMAITAEASEIAEQFVFEVLDGQGRTLSAFAGALTGMLLDYYNQGALYGAAPNEAFVVDVGPQVNTPETIEANELRAMLNVRMSPMAELVTIQIVKTPVTQAVV